MGENVGYWYSFVTRQTPTFLGIITAVGREIEFDQCHFRLPANIFQDVIIDQKVGFVGSHIKGGEKIRNADADRSFICTEHKHY